MSYAIHKGKQLAKKLTQEVKQEDNKVWYADGVRANNAEFREWLKDLTATRQERFNKVTELKKQWEREI